MSFPSESDMVSKELQNSDLIYVNLMTVFLKLSSNIVEKLSSNIAIYRLVGTELKIYDITWLPVGEKFTKQLKS